MYLDIDKKRNYVKKADLRKVIREEFTGYSKYIGKTKGGTSEEYNRILMAIAKQVEDLPGEDDPEQEDSEIEDEDLAEGTDDNTRAEHLGMVRGGLLHLKGLIKREYPYETLLKEVEKLLESIKTSDPLYKVDEGGVTVEVFDSPYRVRVCENGECAVDVPASSFGVSSMSNIKSLTESRKAQLIYNVHGYFKKIL